METNGGEVKIITHDFPIWRDRSNFIINAALDDRDIAHIAEFEQIWARQIEENIFEICCIPFAAYGLALGDLVSTTTRPGRSYLIDKVIEKKGHFTYRIIFLDVNKWNDVVENIRGLGCLVEERWAHSSLVGVDAQSSETAVNLEIYLRDLEANESIQWETGLK